MHGEIRILVYGVDVVLIEAISGSFCPRGKVINDVVMIRVDRKCMIYFYFFLHNTLAFQ